MRTYFSIQDMYCGGCASTIERHLLNLRGVSSASVSFAGTGALIDYDPNTTSLDRINEAIARLGYKPSVSDPIHGGAPDSGEFERALKIRLALAVMFGMWAMAANAVLFLGGTGDLILDVKIGYAAIVLASPVILFSGYPFYVLALRSMRAGFVGMELLISLAVISAVIVSFANLSQSKPTVYVDTAAVLIAFQLLSRLTDFSIRRNAQKVAGSLMSLVPATVDCIIDGAQATTAVGEVEIGDTVLCRAGDVIAVDGQVRQGKGFIDARAMTGESEPIPVSAGDHVIAGSVVVDSVLQIEVTKATNRRAIDSLSQQVLHALTRKSDLCRLADRAAQWVVPLVLIAATIAVSAGLLRGESLSDSLVAGLAALVVTCPCALSIAVPVGFSSVMRGCANLGIELRDPAILEDARPVSEVFLDKTGTLTTQNSVPAVLSLCEQYDDKHVLELAGMAANYSSHPIARMLTDHARISAPASNVIDVVECAGHGVCLTLHGGRELKLGSARWLKYDESQFLPSVGAESASRAFVAIDDHVIGVVLAGFPVRDEVPLLVSQLRQRGKQVCVLSGDREAAVARIAERIGAGYLAEHDASQKIEVIRQRQASGARVAFVGDGLNDGPVLAQADVGIAVAGSSSLARLAAAVVLGRDSLNAIPEFMRLVARGSTVIRQNLWIAGVYNVVMIPVAAAGLAKPDYALIAMMTSVSAVFANSLRLSAKAAPLSR